MLSPDPITFPHATRPCLDHRPAVLRADCAGDRRPFCPPPAFDIHLHAGNTESRRAERDPISFAQHLHGLNRIDRFEPTRPAPRAPVQQVHRPVSIPAADPAMRVQPRPIARAETTSAPPPVPAAYAALRPGRPPTGRLVDLLG